MSLGMASIYDAIKHVLDAEIPTATVPKNNIRPSNDLSDPEAGNMIFYNYISGAEDRKKRRATGILTFSCASVEKDIDANAILELVRDALTARALSYSGSPLRVHLFKENDSLADAETTASGRELAATSFTVKMVEA